MNIDARALDHCVLPVPNLEDARARYNALGFTVAPQGDHPFGTINCCIYFADDTFLEPLAIGSQARVDQAVRNGNMFVARDADYRRAMSDSGFSALVFKTDDAYADHEDFVAAGISAGPILDFSRAFVDPAGNAGKVSFRLAFAASPASDASYFFTCQRIDAADSTARAALEVHPNGVSGIVGVTLTAERPHAHADLLASLTQAPVADDASGIVAKLGNSDIRIVGEAGPLRLSAIRFSVADLNVTARLFESSGIVFQFARDHLRIDPASGQGATFIFEEMS